MVRRVEIVRYITPLREGSSLPALVGADDGAEYVAKFRGAGHGAKALVAELVAGEIGRSPGLPVPEIVLAELPEPIANAEPTLCCDVGMSITTCGPIRLLPFGWRTTRTSCLATAEPRSQRTKTKS